MIYCVVTLMLDFFGGGDLDDLSIGESRILKSPPIIEVLQVLHVKYCVLYEVG